MDDVIQACLLHLLSTQWQVSLEGDGHTTGLRVTGRDGMHDYIQACLLHLLGIQWQVDPEGDGHTARLWVMGRDRLYDLIQAVCCTSLILNGR